MAVKVYRIRLFYHWHQLDRTLLEFHEAATYSLFRYKLLFVSFFEQSLKLLLLNYKRCRTYNDIFVQSSMTQNLQWNKVSQSSEKLTNKCYNAHDYHSNNQIKNRKMFSIFKWLFVFGSGFIICQTFIFLKIRLITIKLFAILHH